MRINENWNKQFIIYFHIFSIAFGNKGKLIPKVCIDNLRYLIQNLLLIFILQKNIFLYRFSKSEDILVMLHPNINSHYKSQTKPITVSQTNKSIFANCLRIIKYAFVHISFRLTTSQKLPINQKINQRCHILNLLSI